jgi:hypothetical protein
MLYQTFASATDAVRNSDGVIGRLADRFGVVALLMMGIAMGGLTALTGI